MNRRGQSTLEYALVLGAILVALVAVVTTVMTPTVRSTMDDSAGVITGATARVQAGLGL